MPNEFPQRSTYELNATGGYWPVFPSGKALRSTNIPDATTAFSQLESPAGGLHPNTDIGGPYSVREYSVPSTKLGAHAHIRIRERTPFHPSYVDHLQYAVDALGLEGDAYYIPLRLGKGTIEGFAQFKKVPDRRGPVLATVLGKHMTPSGQNIEPMFRRTKQASKPETNASPRAQGQFDTDQLAPRLPESRAWNRAHYHGHLPEPLSYQISKAFDGVGTPISGDVIESHHAG